MRRSGKAGDGNQITSLGFPWPWAQGPISDMCSPRTLAQAGTLLRPTVPLLGPLMGQKGLGSQEASELTLGLLLTYSQPGHIPSPTESQFLHLCHETFGRLPRLLLSWSGNPFPDQQG